MLNYITYFSCVLIRDKLVSYTWALWLLMCNTLVRIFSKCLILILMFSNLLFLLQDQIIFLELDFMIWKCWKVSQVQWYFHTDVICDAEPRRTEAILYWSERDWIVFCYHFRKAKKLKISILFYLCFIFAILSTTVRSASVGSLFITYPMAFITFRSI